MKPDAERCAEYEKFKKIDAAFRVGDLAALRAAVDDPAVAAHRNRPGGLIGAGIFALMLRRIVPPPERTVTWGDDKKTIDEGDAIRGRSWLASVFMGSKPTSASHSGRAGRRPALGFVAFGLAG
jgi:hypothetical protein